MKKFVALLAVAMCLSGTVPSLSVRANPASEKMLERSNLSAGERAYEDAKELVEREWDHSVSWTSCVSREELFDEVYGHWSVPPATKAEVEVEAESVVKKVEDEEEIDWSERAFDRAEIWLDCHLVLAGGSYGHAKKKAPVSLSLKELKSWLVSNGFTEEQADEAADSMLKVYPHGKFEFVDDRKQDDDRKPMSWFQKIFSQ